MFSIRKRLEPIEKAYAISLPAWIYTVLVNNISSNSPDIPSACLQIHLFLCFASFLAAAKENQAILSEFGELIFLGTLSLCVKLNSIFFVAAIGLLSLGVALTRIGTPEARRQQTSALRDFGSRSSLLALDSAWNHHLGISPLPFDISCGTRGMESSKG